MSNQKETFKEKFINLLKYKYSISTSSIITLVIALGIILSGIFKFSAGILIFWIMYMAISLLDRVAMAFKRHSKESLMNNKLVNIAFSDWGFVTYIVLIVLLAIYIFFISKLLINRAIGKSFIVPACIIAFSFLGGLEISKLFKKKLKKENK